MSETDGLAINNLSTTQVENISPMNQLLGKIEHISMMPNNIDRLAQEDEFIQKRIIELTESSTPRRKHDAS